MILHIPDWLRRAEIAQPCRQILSCARSPPVHPYVCLLLFRYLASLLHNMEALGAVVTVAQLTDYIVTIIFSIRKAYSRFRFRTERLRHQLQQLERLTIVINTIDNNNSLRGSTISDQSHICEPLKAVAVTVEQIQETLVTEQQRRKERFLVRALNIRLNEVKQNRLKYLFKQLEFDQRTLLLGISDSHMDIVWRIWQLFSNMCTPAPSLYSFNFHRFKWD